MDEEKKNVFSIIQGDATGAKDEDKAIVNTYMIVTKNTDNEVSQEYFAEGFLMPTSQHIMVMRETEQGALPVLLVPLDSVKYVEIVEDFDEEVPGG